MQLPESFLDFHFPHLTKPKYQVNPLGTNWNISAEFKYLKELHVVLPDMINSDFPKSSILDQKMTFLTVSNIPAIKNSDMWHWISQSFNGITFLSLQAQIPETRLGYVSIKIPHLLEKLICLTSDLTYSVLVYTGFNRLSPNLQERNLSPGIFRTYQETKRHPKVFQIFPIQKKGQK